MRCPYLPFIIYGNVHSHDLWWAEKCHHGVDFSKAFIQSEKENIEEDHLNQNILKVFYRKFCPIVAKINYIFQVKWKKCPNIIQMRSKTVSNI